jgi:hypothetical protein
MDMKNIKIIGIFLILSLLMVSSVFATGATIENLPVHWVGYDAAVLAGNVTNAGDQPNITVSFLYKADSEGTWTESFQTAVVSAVGEVTLNVFSLDDGTDYIYQMIADDGGNDIIALGNISFTTNTSPQLSTVTYSGVERTSLTPSITVTDLGDAENFTYFYSCFDTQGTEYNSTEETVTTTGIITQEITGLTEETGYICYAKLEFDIGAATDLIKTSDSIYQATADAETEDVTGILSVQTVVYAAFGLLALMIFAGIAMAVIMIMQKGDGLSADTIINTAIVTIGSAIVLFVGYVIIAAVANGLI